MRLVLVTRDAPQHRYVANVLCERHTIDRIVVVDDVRRPAARWMRRLHRRYGLAGLAERALLRVWGQLGGPTRQRRRELRRLLGSRADRFERTQLVVRARGLSSPQTIQAVEDAEPDVLLVYGTGIVSDEVLSTARLIALNLHTGVSPDYRGADCAFWPLHDGRPDMVGATVHECTSRVDGGRIFATTRAELRPDDGVETVFVRSVIAGAELYADVLARLPWEEIDHLGVPQDLSSSPERRAAQRGLRAELRARRQIRSGLLHDVGQLLGGSGGHGGR